MSGSKQQGAAIVGVGAVACAACCAGPVLGFLAAVGAGTLLGIALFGLLGAVVTLVGIGWLLRRRRRRRAACRPTAIEVALPTPIVRELR